MRIARRLINRNTYKGGTYYHLLMSRYSNSNALMKGMICNLILLWNSFVQQIYIHYIDLICSHKQVFLAFVIGFFFFFLVRAPEREGRLGHVFFSLTM